MEPMENPWKIDAIYPQNTWDFHSGFVRDSRHVGFSSLDKAGKFAV